MACDVIMQQNNICIVHTHLAWLHLKKCRQASNPVFKAGIGELPLTPYNIYNNYYYLFMLIFSFIYNVHPNHEPSAEQAYVHTQIAKWVFLAHHGRKKGCAYGNTMWNNRLEGQE